MRIAAALIAGLTLVVGVTGSAALAGAGTTPKPPELPDDFTWTGRYLVPDLDVDVPYTWTGTDGDTQMIAGSDDDPIHFTNVIAGGQLYTLTYKWPGIDRRPCSPVGPFTVADLNKGLADARFVGPEILSSRSGGACTTSAPASWSRCHPRSSRRSRASGRCASR
jgi:hypothetical protein